MYLLIYKNDCESCKKAKKILENNNIKFREVNCSSEKLSIDDIEIMKTTPGNNLSIFLKKKYTVGKLKISRIELKEMYDDFLKYGSLPIIIKYNFLNKIENYMIGFVERILNEWINDDSIVGQYIDVNSAFKFKDCCYMCNKKKNTDDINLKKNDNISIKKLENLKKENQNFFEKYTKNSWLVENKNIDENELIMANQNPEYDKKNQKIEFKLKRESTSTIEIPIFDDQFNNLEDNEKTEDQKILDKFKEKLKKIGKNKFNNKEQEFIIEHIDSKKEISELEIDLYDFSEQLKMANTKNIQMKNILELEKDLDIINKKINNKSIPKNNSIENSIISDNIFELKENEYKENNLKINEIEIYNISNLNEDKNMKNIEEKEIKYNINIINENDVQILEKEFIQNNEPKDITNLKEHDIFEIDEDIDNDEDDFDFEDEIIEEDTIDIEDDFDEEIIDDEDLEDDFDEEIIDDEDLEDDFDEEVIDDEDLEDDFKLKNDSSLFEKELNKNLKDFKNEIDVVSDDVINNIISEKKEL